MSKYKGQEFDWHQDEFDFEEAQPVRKSSPGVIVENEVTSTSTLSPLSAEKN
jgi:hypothetical protein